MLSPSSSKSVSIVTDEGLSKTVFSTTSSNGFPEIEIMFLKPSDSKAMASFLPSTITQPSSFNFSITSKNLGESIII